MDSWASRHEMSDGEASRPGQNAPESSLLSQGFERLALWTLADVLSGREATNAINEPCWLWIRDSAAIRDDTVARMRLVCDAIVGMSETLPAAPSPDGRRELIKVLRLEAELRAIAAVLALASMTARPLEHELHAIHNRHYLPTQRAVTEPYYGARRASHAGPECSTGFAHCCLVGRCRGACRPRNLALLGRSEGRRRARCATSLCESCRAGGDIRSCRVSGQQRTRKPRVP